jgi:hypothetical protein
VHEKLKKKSSKFVLFFFFKKKMNAVRNVVSLGAALHTVLRECSARALTSSLVLDDTSSTSTSSTSTTMDALYALRTHSDSHELIRAILHTCIDEERVRGDMRVIFRNAQTLVAWLLQLSRRDAVFSALCDLAAADDRKAALLAWVLVRDRLSRLSQVHADAVKAKSGAPAKSDVAKIVDLSPDADRFATDVQLRSIRLVRDDVVSAVGALIAPARAVIADESDADGENRRRADAENELRATRLRVTALDALLDGAALLANVHSFEHSVMSGASTAAVLGAAGGNAMTSMLGALLHCLPSVRRWFERPRPLFAFALERLERLLRGINAIEPREALLDLAVYHLSFFAPYATSDAAAVQVSGVVGTVQKLLDNVYHPLQPLSGALPEDELEKEAEEQSFRSCLAVCLALGHHGERRLRDVLHQVPAARLLDVAVGQFHGPAQNATARIAAQLASAAIGVVQKQDAQSLLEPLTDLLKSSVPTSVSRTNERVDLLQRDSVAEATALLLARVIGAINAPGALRSALLSLLEASGDDKVQAAMQRHNALVLLEQLLVVLADAPADSPLVLELAQVLLDRLGDDEVQLRSVAARLFGRLDSTFVVGELVQRALVRDVRLRSAAERALLEHMQQLPASKLPAALVLVLNEVEKSGNVTDDTDSMAAGDVGARVLRTLPQWLSALSFEQGAATMRLCVDAALSMPRSPVGARLVAGVARALPQQHAAGAADQIGAVLLKQGRLNEATLETVADDAAQLGNLLFGRVAPLLLLRALPARSLLCASNDLTKRLCTIMCDRIDEPVEFDQVRKLAAECLARLAVAFDVALPRLNGPALDVSKAYLFAALNAVVIADGHADTLPTERLISALVAVFARQVTNKDVEQLQRGAIECLAALANVSLGNNCVVDDNCDDGDSDRHTTGDSFANVANHRTN